MQISENEINTFLSDAVKYPNEHYACFGAYDLETRQWKLFVVDALMPD